jgi:hypothetical protein
MTSSTIASTHIATVHHDRAWWRAEAVRTRTDMSSLLRQRLRVRAWIRAGRPPMAQWQRELNASAGDAQ